MEKITQGRLNKCFKYFKNKRVHIKYEYNNSQGHHHIRELKTKYDSFKIDTVNLWTMVILSYKGKTIFTQGFPVDTIYDKGFIGLGSIKMNNGDGTYNYFKIKRKWFL